MGNVTALMSILGLVQGVRASTEAADNQRRAAIASEEIANTNAIALEAETAEKSRRMEKSQREQTSSARAKAAASGTKANSGSMNDVIDEMSSEYSRQLSWLKTSGKSQADIIRKGGKIAADLGRSGAKATEAKGVANFFSDTGTAVTQTGKAGWWTK